MSAFVDFEEKTVEKAVEKACAELKISKDRLQYDIISHGSSGIFGLVGAKKALIRVLVPDAKEPVKMVKRAAEAEQVTALVNEAFGSPEAVAEETVPQQRPAALPLDAEQRQALVEWVQGFIVRTVEMISPEAKIVVEQEDPVFRFRIQEGDSARLIGKRGQTLEAVQYLAEKAVIKQFGTAPVVEIDVEGYLDKRRTDLVAMATRLAEKAQETGKPMVINRINAQDRRVIHLSLKDNRNVRTQSVGNGDFRKLLILPKKKANGKKGENRESGLESS